MATIETPLRSPWQQMLQKVRLWALTNSPWAIHYNSGSCNGCDIEIMAPLMPEPKFVMAVGSCGTSSGVFHGCYNIVGGINEVLPVDVFVPGCPPRPEAIINGMVQLLNSLKKS
jgi:Ni,Fe-hydrogenase III small subunit